MKILLSNKMFQMKKKSEIRKKLELEFFFQKNRQIKGRSALAIM